MIRFQIYALTNCDLLWPELQTNASLLEGAAPVPNSLKRDATRRGQPQFLVP